MFKDELYVEVKNLGVFYEFLFEVYENGKFLVVNFVVGGVVILVDVVFMMYLGVDGVFVGFGIFKLDSFEKFVCVIVEVIIYYMDYKLIVEVFKNLGVLMKGIEIFKLFVDECMFDCGW